MQKIIDYLAEEILKAEQAKQEKKIRMKKLVDSIRSKGATAGR